MTAWPIARSADVGSEAQVAPAPAPTLETVTSQLCTAAQFSEPVYRRICAEIGQTPVFHRKQWEYIYILRALEQAFMLQPGRSGLGFGCGKEPLAAVMAKRGVNVVCTDIVPLEKGDAYWGATSVKDYFYEGICDMDTFMARASFKEVNMNAIPGDLGQHDFIWSSCALEHLGSLQHGMDFVVYANKCLKPGGIAVHTTEYNVRDDEHTFETEGLSLYRKRDILALKDQVERLGHRFVPINFDPGDHEMDLYVDAPPYSRDRHLKLLIDGQYTITSIGFIIVKQ